jgi:low affinity Fe/Cu permease
MSISKIFSDVAAAVALAAGRPLTFAICVAVVVAWALSGPLFQFSETWQLVINTGTTIVTFLMVFLIQNTQNRDGAAIQTKLDELIRVSAAKNAYIGIEHLSQEELEDLRQRCEMRAKSNKLGGVKSAAGPTQKAANKKAARADRATGST